MNQDHLPRTMQAAILAELRKPLIIDQVELPEQLDVGQVLVKVHYSGICGSQLGEIDGVKGEDKYLPHLLGHEGSGIVLAVGPGVRHVKTNDRVVLHWRKGLGIESQPPVYRWRGQRLNAGWVTTFNEYAVVSENRLTPIPQDSDLRIAALFGCAVTTGFGVVENNAHLRIGESVVVYGAGGVGLNIVQASALVSAYPIIAVDRFSNRLELARKLGATHCINSEQQDAQHEIASVLGGRVLDSFIDNTGQPSIIQMGYRLTGSKGRVVLVGVPKIGNDILIHSLPLHFGKTLTGSFGGESQPNDDIPRYLRFCQDRGIDLNTLISDQFLLRDINAAIIAMTGGKASGRCVLEI